MEIHFYLRAVVSAYENKFAHLVELLPDEQPSDKVWSNIEAHIRSSKERHERVEKLPWWKASFFKQSLGLAALALIVSTVLVFNPMTITPIATAYSAVLESDSNELMAITKVKKSDMKLSIEIMKPIQVTDDMELTLWCNPKRGGMPMKMGTILMVGRTEIKISNKEWQSMKDVGELAISIEHKGDNTTREPTGEIILRGQLISIN